MKSPLGQFGVGANSVRPHVSLILGGVKGGKPKGWASFERLQVQHNVLVPQTMAGLMAELGKTTDT